MTVEDSDVYGIVYPNGGFIVISSQKIRKVTVHIYFKPSVQNYNPR